MNESVGSLSSITYYFL